MKTKHTFTGMTSDLSTRRERGEREGGEREERERREREARGRGKERGEGESGREGEREEEMWEGGREKASTCTTLTCAV